MNIERATKNLSEAITYQTISQVDLKDIDKGAYESFLQFLEASYPTIHKRLEKTLINHFSPLYYWKGSDSSRRILFLAHYDVVPASDEGWTYPPFSGRITEGKIHGRGASDNKNSVIALLETIESLLEARFTPAVDVYVALGYDEENHGHKGAGRISSYLVEKGLSFDLILDEGGIVTQGSMMGIDEEIAVIGVCEKGNSVIDFTFSGDEGHSSAPPRNTSIGKMAAFIKDVEDHPRKAVLVEPVASMLKTIAPYRGGLEQKILKNPETFFPILKRILDKNKETSAMLRSTVSFTMTHSGSAPNVLPGEATCTANIRVLPGDSIQEIKRYFKSFDHEFRMTPRSLHTATRVSRTDTSAYRYLEHTIQAVFPKVVMTPYLMIGGTDSRHYDALSENIYRFMPCVLTQEELALMHATGEYLSVSNLEKMLIFYEHFLRGLEELYDL